MTTTLQTVVDQARRPLNDDKDSGGSDAACRYPDSELLSYVIHGLLHSFRSRGDLWVGNFSTPPSLALTLGSTFPLPDEYVQVFADYATARAESKDDEFVDGGRAAAFYQLFGAVVPS